MSNVLRAEAPALGYSLLNNLLLVDDRTTAQLDHVLVDRFGVLVVETKNYRALIKGKSDDRFWTACYSGPVRRRDRFLNPLRQNDRHREILQRVLDASGRSLPASYVQSLVVFAGGDLESLGVDEVDSMRVVSDSEVADYLQARCGDFPPNRGALDAEQVSDLASLLRSVDHSNDPDVVAIHGENVRRATRRFGDRLRERRAAPSPSVPANPYGAATVYHQSSRYPDGSQHAPVRRRSSVGRLITRLAALTLWLALVWWAVLGGGLTALGRLGDSVIAGVIGRAPQALEGNPAPATASVAYDTRLALLRLKEVDAKTYAKLADPSEPRLSTTKGLPTYTWHYLEKTGRDSVAVREISVTLDASGRIVGVSSGEQ